MKCHCLCCGKEFKPNENIQILYGRHDGKTILSFIKTIELRTCIHKCAAHLTKLAYDYFFANSLPDEKSSF